MHKSILDMCLCAVTIVVSWFLSGTVTGQDPSTSMKVLMSGAGGAREIICIVLFACLIALIWVGIRKIRKIH